MVEFDSLFGTFLSWFEMIINFIDRPLFKVGLFEISLFGIFTGGLFIYIVISLFWKGGSA